MAATARGASWTTADIPDLSGRTVVVTGASAGLGRETAMVMASRGATVVLACRDVAKGAAVADSIVGKSVAGHQPPRVVRLDLASLSSVRAAAEDIRANCARLDVLVNNAGVMLVPFQLTEDGFELTFATNHLGHFALTGLLLERLLETPHSRVVTISSNAHRRARLDLEDLVSERNYNPGQAYDRSKLANLLFAYELQRRLQAANATAISLAAHPGNVRTDLWRTSSRFERVLIGPRLRPLNSWLAQSVRDGALPAVRAAVDPAARGGDYFGPAGWGQYTGRPIRVDSSPRSHDREAQHRLWTLSEHLTGISYPFQGGGAL